MAIGYCYCQVPLGERYAELQMNRGWQDQGAAEKKEQQQISSENVMSYPVRHRIFHEIEKTLLFRHGEQLQVPGDDFFLNNERHEKT